MFKFKKLIVLLALLLTSCKSSVDVSLQESSIKANDIGQVQNVNFNGGVPGGTSSSPSIVWEASTPSNQEVVIDHYEARLINISQNNQVVEDWRVMNNGGTFSGLALDEYSIYRIQMRAVTTDSEYGATTLGPAWIPGSNDCMGEKIFNTPFAAGNGSLSNPYLICTKTQLQALSQAENTRGDYYQLDANINLGQTTFIPIGLTNFFQGNLEGSNKKIKNLNISSISTDDGFGFIAKAYNAKIMNLNFIDPIVNYPNGEYVGTLVGFCHASKLENISISNLSVTGLGVAGGLVGEAYSCDSYNITVSGNVNSTGEGYTGGVVGNLSMGKHFHITSTVDVDGTGQESIGGFGGSTSFNGNALQYADITSNVLGDIAVGGLAGGSWDGFQPYRNSFTGTVTGNQYVGGLVGENGDNYFRIRSNNLNATVSGNQRVGGILGGLSYTSYIENNSGVVTINGTGVSPSHIGGIVGAVDDTPHITQNLIQSNIVSTGDNVGGFIGSISYNPNPSTGIADNMIISNVEGSSAANDVSVFMGANADLAITGSNFYSTGSICNNLGTGVCNTDTVTGVAESNFYSSAFAPLSGWDTSNLWLENAGALPTVRTLASSTPTASDDCSANYDMGGTTSYSCTVTITDTDLNEHQYLKFLPDHTCNWLYVESDIATELVGYPNESDLGPCRISYFLTDGINDSPSYGLDVNVEPSLFITLKNDQLSLSNIWSPYRIRLTGVGLNNGDNIFEFEVQNLESSAISGLSIAITSSIGQYLGGTYPGTGGDCSSSLEPMEKCTLVMVINPPNTGGISGTFDLAYNGSRGATAYSRNWSSNSVGHPFRFYRPDMFQINSIAFLPSTSVSGGPATYVLTLTNNSTEAINNMDATIAGPIFEFTGGGVFPGVGGSCGTDLAAGASCTISVDFDPASTGTFIEAFDFSYSQGEANTYSFDLRANGT